jgi:hypothetical protein
MPFLHGRRLEAIMNLVDRNLVKRNCTDKKDFQSPSVIGIHSARRERQARKPSRERGQ